MNKIILSLSLLLMCTGCLEGLTGDGPFKPYTIGSLTATEPIQTPSSWDDYLNNPPIITEEEKEDSALAVLGIVDKLFIPTSEDYPYDVWRELKFHDGVGDCEDHALTVMKLLLLQGWNPEDVLLLSTESHMMVGVVIHGDVYSIDSWYSDLRPVREDTYKILEIYHRGKWYSTY